MSTWRTKVDYRAPGAELRITNESRVVGAQLPGFALLNEVPRLDAPSSVIVTIGATTYTEVTGTPGPNQYRVRYTDRLEGAIEFHSSAAGLVALVTYWGRGSNLFAADFNALQAEKVDRDGSIAFTGSIRFPAAVIGPTDIGGTATVRLDGDMAVGGPLLAASLGVTGAAGTVRGLEFLTGAKYTGLRRWHLYLATGTEDGANVGANLALSRYADDGSLLGDVLSFRRDTGDVTVVAGGGTVVIGPGPTTSERVRVGGDVRLTGKLLTGVATSLGEVAVGQVGARLTFFGDGSGWQFRIARQAVYGGAATDLVSIYDNGTIAPGADNVADLGTIAVRWRSMYAYAGVFGPIDPGGTTPLRVGGGARISGSVTVNGGLSVDAAVVVGSTLTTAGGITATGDVNAASFKMGSVSFADHSVGYTRLFDDSTRVGLMIGNAATGHRTWYGATSHEWFEVTLSAQLMTLDGVIDANQTGLSLNIGGSMRRVLVGANDSAGPGKRLLTVLN
jgi:hypothetical protein